MQTDRASADEVNFEK